MTTQAGLFDAPTERTASGAPSAPEFDAAGARLRLRVLGEWLHTPNRAGVKLSYGVVTRDPWADYAKGGRDLDAFDRKIQKRKTKPTHEQRNAEFEREFVWLAWGVNVGQQKVKVAVPAPCCAASHVTREIAEESARGFASIFDAPAEVVVRYVLTGEVTL